jgi:hypothetical protein
MTWIIILFTWRVVTITNQWLKPHCVAHAVSACAGIYKINDKPSEIVDYLNIWSGGYNINLLPKSKYNISHTFTGTKKELQDILDTRPLLWGIPKGLISKTQGNHYVCIVWYNKNGLYYANSYGNKRWVWWYGIISWKLANQVLVQTIGTWSPWILMWVTRDMLKRRYQEPKQQIKQIEEAVKD